MALVTPIKQPSHSQIFKRVVFSTTELSQPPADIVDNADGVINITKTVKLFSSSGSDKDLAIQTFLKRPIKSVYFGLRHYLITRSRSVGSAFSEGDRAVLSVIGTGINYHGDSMNNEILIESLTDDSSGRSYDFKKYELDFLNTEFTIFLSLGGNSIPMNLNSTYQFLYASQQFKQIYLDFEISVEELIIPVEKPLTLQKREKQQRKRNERQRDLRRKRMPSKYQLGDKVEVHAELDDEIKPVWWEIVGKNHRDYLGQIMPFQGLEGHVQLTFEEEDILNSVPPRDFQRYREFNRTGVDTKEQDDVESIYGFSSYNRQRGEGSSSNNQEDDQPNETSQE